MGPKAGKSPKEIKIPIPAFADDVNNDAWKCAVSMGVEKEKTDNFVVEKFEKEAGSCFRPEVRCISFTLVMKQVKYFMENKLEERYKYLLNFKPVLEEAATFLNEDPEAELPACLIADLVKIMIFLMRDEDLRRLEKLRQPVENPIDGMKRRQAACPVAVVRPTVADKGSKNKKASKGGTRDKKGKGGELVKEATNLLRRGEGSTKEFCDDAPLDAYFQFYIMLTGFYDTDLPLELVKKKVPLHGMMCIDSSYFGRQRKSSKDEICFTEPGEEVDTLLEKIRNFWPNFLRILWTREYVPYFREMVFQVYSPINMPSNKIKLNEFIYNEITFLMYELSDYKRQQKNYLRNMRLWDVTEEEERVPMVEEYIAELDDVRADLVTVPIVMQFILDTLCGEDALESVYLGEEEGDTYRFWDRGSYYGEDMQVDIQVAPEYSTTSTVDSRLIPKHRLPSPNVDEALHYEKLGGIVGLLFKNFPLTVEDIVSMESSICSRSPNVNIPQIIIDYCLYLLWMTKLPCPYETQISEVEIMSVRAESDLDWPCEPKSMRVGSFVIIDNMDDEFYKPHFTVTDCSRSLLKTCRPHYMMSINTDFFMPSELKIVTPATMKAFSAPELYRVAMPIPLSIPSIKNSFVSELNVPKKYLQGLALGVYEDIRVFLGEEVFANANGFDFVEEHNKRKMFKESEEACTNYNCLDYTFSMLTDNIYVILHNRKNEDCVYCEPFNISLKTQVGLRDFFEYILEDEKVWAEAEKAAYNQKMKELEATPKPNPLFDPTPDFRDFEDIDFMLETSIKFLEILQNQASALKLAKGTAKDTKSKESSKEKGSKKDKDGSSTGKETQVERVPSPINAVPGEPYLFDGYDVSILAVQFSGLKTVFLSPENCSTRVELQERLYGTQDLGLHVWQGGHLLNMYSFVCPKPHILDPYTFHVSLKSGVVVAFMKRFFEITVEDGEEALPPAPPPTAKTTELGPEAEPEEKMEDVKISDPNFAYDMTISVPSGLMVEVKPQCINPSYIRQYYLVHPQEYSEVVKNEKSRLCLPNGNVVITGLDGSVHILRIDTLTLSSTLEDFVYKVPRSILDAYGQEEEEMGEGYLDGLEVWLFRNFESSVTEKTTEGRYWMVLEEKVSDSRKLRICRQMDVETQTVYFSREDDTHFSFSSKDVGCGETMLYCVEFTDGTKISSEYFVEDQLIFADDEEYGEGGILMSDWPSTTAYYGEQYGEEGPLGGFVSVHIKITMEHPDYATACYETLTKTWTILLPDEASVKVEPNGCYSANLDPRTKLDVSEYVVEMSHKDEDGITICETLIDLSVFEEESNSVVYCTTTDSTGKRFIVESSSACHVVHFGDQLTGEEEQMSIIVGGEDVAEEEMTLCLPPYVPGVVQKGNRLQPESRYFVLRRDLGGFELQHIVKAKHDIQKAEWEGLVFTDMIPGMQQLRYFVLLRVAPEKKNGIEKWQVPSITPRAKFDPFIIEFPPRVRSTYGVPPSWIHPFPMVRKKIEIPEELICRVFIETKQTNSYTFPTLGEFSFCVIEEVEREHTILEPGAKNIQDYFRKIGDDDQDILKEMYALAVLAKINANKRFLASGGEKLAHFLEMSAWFLRRAEYHKNAINCCLIPNFWRHPRGMSWKILQQIIDENIPTPSPIPTPPPSSTTTPSFIISGDELEYNIAWTPEQSLSELSYRTNMPNFTAPADLYPQDDDSDYLSTLESRHYKSEPNPHICRLLDPPCPPKSTSTESVVTPEIIRETCSFTSEDILKIHKKKKPKIRKKKFVKKKYNDTDRLSNDT